jgi:hypothetical protein
MWVVYIIDKPRAAGTRSTVCRTNNNEDVSKTLPIKSASHLPTSTGDWHCTADGPYRSRIL